MFIYSPFVPLPALGSIHNTACSCPGLWPVSYTHLSLENLKDRLGIPADKYKDKNGKDRIDHFEERVLKPAKAARDESCPYTCLLYTSLYIHMPHGNTSTPTAQQKAPAC